MTLPPIRPAAEIADAWAHWCGENRWTKALREFHDLGGLVRWWCGYPQSASAIPLTFELFRADGTALASEHRLKDIRAAIVAASER